MLKTQIKILFTLLVLPVFLLAQNTNTATVMPDINQIGVNASSDIEVILNHTLDQYAEIPDNIFNVYTKGGSIITGHVNRDTSAARIIFSPDRDFFAGEVINVIFGRIYSSDYTDTIDSFSWQFTVGVTNPTPPYFSEPVRYYVSDLGYYITPFDLNSDGFIDLITSDGYVYYNNGSGYFDVYMYQPEFLDAAIFADLNNDGLFDFITIPRWGSSEVKLQNEEGVFAVSHSFDNLGPQAIGDITGDSFIDILVVGSDCECDQCTGWAVMENLGDGSFFLSDSFCLPGRVSPDEVFDIDNDGDLDVVLTSNTWFFPYLDIGMNGIIIYENDNGKLIFKDTIPTRMIQPDLEYADLNNDGRLDLITYYNLVFYNYDSTFTKIDWLAGPIKTNLTASDLDGDNFIDWIIGATVLAPEDSSSPVNYSVCYNPNTLPDSTKPVNYIKVFCLGTLQYASGPKGALPLDLDNDGDLDLVHYAFGGPFFVTFNTSVVDVEDKEIISVPELFSIEAFPNPFNSEINIQFTLPVKGMATLKAYDILGREISVIAEEYLEAGMHTFRHKFSNLNSGTYLIRLTSGRKSITKKILHIK